MIYKGIMFFIVYSLNNSGPARRPRPRVVVPGRRPRAGAPGLRGAHGRRRPVAVAGPRGRVALHGPCPAQHLPSCRPGRGDWVGSPWGRKESDTTERLNTSHLMVVVRTEVGDGRCLAHYPAHTTGRCLQGRTTINIQEGNISR